MAKAVFTTTVSPAYDDLPEQRITSRRDTSGQSKPGWATGSCTPSRADPLPSCRVAADGSPTSPRPASWTFGPTPGARITSTDTWRRAVRPIRDVEYHVILQAGFRDFADARWRMRESGPVETERCIVERISRRPCRDRVFSMAVRTAYNNMCAVTGLRIINGGGRPEVQAAHIKPVAKRGPDSMRNGLALSGTAHWMFDRGLISVADDYTLLLREGAIPGHFFRIINEDRRLRVPKAPSHRPHPNFLKYHREQVFQAHA